MIYKILKNFRGRTIFGPFLQKYAIFAYKITSKLEKDFINFNKILRILERKMCAEGRKR